jgi:hypothetical protein
MTRNLALQTDDSGVAQFRGFYGTYRATVRTADGNQQPVEFRLSREQQARWIFNLGSK